MQTADGNSAERPIARVAGALQHRVMEATTLFCVGGPLHGVVHTAVGGAFVLEHASAPWRNTGYRATLVDTRHGPQHVWLHEHLSLVDATGPVEAMLAAEVR